MSSPDFLSITKEKIILFFSITLSVTLLVSLIIVLAFTCGGKPSEPASVSESESPKTIPESVSIADFMFEEHSFGKTESSYYLSRPRMSKWSKEQVMQFFIPTQKILRDYFSKMNDNRVREFFEGIK